MLRFVDDELTDMAGNGLENLLYFLLIFNDNLSKPSSKFLTKIIDQHLHKSNGPFDIFIGNIKEHILNFFDKECRTRVVVLEDDRDAYMILYLAEELRKEVYKFGTPRQILLGDIISAVMKKMVIEMW